MPAASVSATNPFGLPWSSTGAAQAQHTAQTAAADHANFSRQQQQTDFGQSSGQFMGLLEGLKQAGFLGDTSTSSSSGSGSGSGVPGSGVPANAGGSVFGGTWTPSMAAGSRPMAQLPSPVNATGAAFARAKDTVGQSLQGLTKALGNQFSTRNMSGSSAEVAATGNTLLRGNQQLADVARQGAEKEADASNTADLARFNGDVAQRGQDASADATRLSGFLTGRGQDISAEEARLAREQEARQFQTQSKTQNLGSIMGLWGSLNGGTAPGLRY